MGLPSPQVPLDKICTTIYNNTLYTYSYDAFQSLSLTKGAEWVQLSTGVKVTGAACVKGTPTDGASQDALYIVGGKANSTMSSYQGLQRYTFATGKWDTLTATDPVTQNRLYHSAVYLNASSSILMYAGSQDGSMAPSSQTFTINTLPPYQVTAFQWIEAPAVPAVAPLLIQWTQSKAVMIGGSETNTKVMMFSPSNSWEDTGATLAQPLKNSTFVKAIVINGDDASKTLYTFDMTTSPNSVNRTVLINGDGNPQVNAAPITERSLEEVWDTESRIEKRGNLTVAGWPSYNATLAPKSTRSDYAVARDQSGQTIIAGGNQDDVLCIFKARDNCWANATAQLGTSQVVVGLGDPDPTTSSSVSLATSSATATTTTAASQDDPDASRNLSLKILGIVLGSIIGVALLLLLALLFLRWRRRKRNFQEAGHQRRASGIPNGEKSPMEYADRGLPFNTPRHAQQESQGSFSSMAILMGKVGGQPRGMLGRRKGSNGSDSSSAFNKKYKTAISNPIPQTAPVPSENFMRGDKGISFAAGAAAAPAAAAVAPSTSVPGAKPRASGGRRGSTRRSSGWNRYWSGGSALNIMGFGSKRATYESGRSERSSNSHYSDLGLPMSATQNSALPPPLKLGDRPALMNRVVSGSPTIAQPSHGYPLKEGMSGQIERHNSVSTTSSYNDDNRDAFSSGIPASVHEQQSWTPVGGEVPWGANRGPSVAYSESNYAATAGRNTLADLNAPRQPMPNFTNLPAGSNRAPPVQSSDMSWLNLGGKDDRI